MRARATRAGILVVMLWLVRGTALAEAVDFGGIVLEPPEGWLLEDPERVRREIERSGGIEDAGALVAVWREPGAERRGRIVLTSHSASLRPGRLSPARVRALLETWKAGCLPARGLEIEEVRRAEAGGVSARRVRLRLAGCGVELEQVLYILCGRETFVLGLSGPPARFAELLPAFERVLGTVTVERRPPGYLASLWFWSGLVSGLVAGELRRRRCRPRKDLRVPRQRLA